MADAHGLILVSALMCAGVFMALCAFADTGDAREQGHSTLPHLIAAIGWAGFTVLMIATLIQA